MPRSSRLRESGLFPTGQIFARSQPLDRDLLQESYPIFAVESRALISTRPVQARTEVHLWWCEA